MRETRTKEVISHFHHGRVYTLVRLRMICKVSTKEISDMCLWWHRRPTVHTHMGTSLQPPKPKLTIFIGTSLPRGPMAGGMGAAVGSGADGKRSFSLWGSRAHFNGQGQQWNDQEEKLLPLCISYNLISIIPCAIPFATGRSKHGP